MFRFVTWNGHTEMAIKSCAEYTKLYQFMLDSGNHPQIMMIV